LSVHPSEFPDGWQPQLTIQVQQQPRQADIPPQGFLFSYREWIVCDYRRRSLLWHLVKRKIKDAASQSYFAFCLIEFDSVNLELQISPLAKLRLHETRHNDLNQKLLDE